MPPTSDILSFVLFFGGPAGLQFLVSRVLPLIPGWKEAQDKRKMVVVGALAIILPQLVAVVGVQIPQEIWDSWNPQFQILATSVQFILSWAGGEVSYQALGEGKQKRRQAQAK